MAKLKEATLVVPKYPLYNGPLHENNIVMSLKMYHTDTTADVPENSVHLDLGNVPCMDQLFKGMKTGTSMIGAYVTNPTLVEDFDIDLAALRVEEVIDKGSYGFIYSAYDTHLGEKVTIQKINDILEHVSDATRILREIKLLSLLRHSDIVEIKHILLPHSRREFKDKYVVFKHMEFDLHQVIKANDDLTPEHYQIFLY
ncbi:hypothetical protein RJ640_006338 [Escallonia rubra]|uniref:Protein kinase domain-containing protein n=1 Tax=Escallonia rubra TaxID=112253 RepID=A0AA88R570_9ASTE|nr:hypothetical protein RJ640_006338 [Escallonia rubra]